MKVKMGVKIGMTRVEYERDLDEDEIEDIKDMSAEQVDEYYSTELNDWMANHVDAWIYVE